MSWFDASGFANIAKSALREAQRTIDKALDIKEDEINAAQSNTPIDPNSEDFFGSWNVTNQSEKISEPTQTRDGKLKLMQPSGSIWGSFTGSFFDNSKDEPLSPSIDGLDDSLDANHEHFSGSKLVVQQSDDILSIAEGEEESSPEGHSVKWRDKPSSAQINRLSIVSIESGKNSSESVELITCSTECTTSPDSDLHSTEQSISTSSSAIAKQTSDSVEVLVDSLTSPSMEILALDKTDSSEQFASPEGSPLDEEVNLNLCNEKTSPESVEVIPEDQEESVAEDTMSYTSISESTSATVLDQGFVHLKPQIMLKDTFNNAPLNENEVTLDKSNLPEAITRAPSRSGMHLPLAQVTSNQPVDTQPQSTRSDLSHLLLKNTNIIDIPLEGADANMIESCDEGSQSDRTIIGGMDSSSDTSIAEPNSTYLKHLIADAMTEKAAATPNQDEDSTNKSMATSSNASGSHFMDLSQSMLESSPKSESVSNSYVLENISISQLDMPPRETSPLSSESRSDLVKIGSDHTSGHTSGDELETTTSSDIEIISSPNGDSSSTQSRQSPAKLTGCSAIKIGGRSEESNSKKVLGIMTMKKVKGHNRELSEASSISDDAHYTSEMDRLVKRIAEMTEILESRETKLIEVNRNNAELVELNANFKRQIDEILTKQLQSIDVSQVTEEYTQRLSALEKKFQQAIREKDTLRKQLEQTKLEAASRMSKNELEELLGEKDEIIRELRHEGEKLSKQQLQHSNIIKKLRVKEKENEGQIKNLKETIETLTSDIERLKRSLTAKEEVERSQIEAVHQLTAKNKKIESDLTKLQSAHDDLLEKYETAKKSLDAAKKELVDKNRTSSELIAREHKLESLENEKRQTESQNAAIINELEDLRSKLRQLESEHVKKEQMLRKENNDLMRRLEEAEGRNEELSQSVLDVSKPLVRQLDSLQATYTLKIGHYEKIEQELTQKISELQGRLQTSQHSEKVMKEESILLRSKVSDLESEVSSLKHQNEMMTMEIERQRAEKQLTEQELKQQITNLQELVKAEKEKNEEMMRDSKQLQEQLERTSHDVVEQKKTHEMNASFDRNSPQTGSNSPTLSLGKVSVADSLSSSFWSQNDEPFDVGQAPRYTNMFEMQMLQTNLKQRHGEVQQLQWELNRREQERALLNLEISSLLTKVEELEARVKENESFKVQFSEIQQQYDTLCQLYGEKVEENEELKLDLEDVKDMYKCQIDELLKQQKEKS